ncbi:hypothetical protein OXT66_07975 [Lentilactobacillus senioris]|uniref:hypothetical protein n=1 Tax=Lentilactobacillus senioris TaxID=931534 RepID=UPI0022810BE8|nr:hypothetical protein [Lentilactobacillus senioris]MCY9807470.1 hypothetical protein [Lentilactobacillus senioris]
MRRFISKYMKSILISFFSSFFGGLLVVCLFFTDDNFGSLADWIGSLGTVGAVWLSLYLATKKEPLSAEIYIETTNFNYPNKTRGNDYLVGSTVRVINPDQKNYLINLDSIGLFLDNVELEKFNLQFYRERGKYNLTQKFMAQSGSDLELFTVDWANIFQTFEEHSDADRWKVLKGTFDSKVQIRLSFTFNTGDKQDVIIIPPYERHLLKK